MEPIDEARMTCLRFAREHNLTFTERGQVGFGRSCVGFTSGGHYVDYNPHRSDGDYEPIKGLYFEDFPTVENAYHKHDCLAVLAYDDEYDKSVLALAEWVAKMEARGPVAIVEYQTGADGLQAMISGTVGRAVQLSR